MVVVVVVVSVDELIEPIKRVVTLSWTTEDRGHQL